VSETCQPPDEDPWPVDPKPPRATLGLLLPMPLLVWVLVTARTVEDGTGPDVNPAEDAEDDRPQIDRLVELDERQAEELV